MSEDPELAIEKLAEYRASSKKITKFVEKDSKNLKDSPFRSFFLNYYWVNATIATTLLFTMLLGGWSVIAPIWVISSMVLLSTFIRQTFNTINRLEISGGRATTLDDTIVVLLIAGSFFLFSIFDFVSQSLFIQIHLVLLGIWILQIVFVNFLKPDLSHAHGSAIIEETGKFTFTQKIKEFFTLQRSAVFVVSITISIVLTVL